MGPKIIEEPGELPVPESHVLLAWERLAEHRATPADARSAYDALDKLPSKPC